MDGWTEGAISARPHAPVHGHERPGSHPLWAGEGGRHGLLVVPATYAPDAPAPLLVLLHGAGGDAAGIARLLAPLSEALGPILLVPESLAATWDVIASRLGPDVSLLDRALAATFDRVAVDRGRVAVAGFSDGASYALTLGLANGELFSAVLAFSPGFAAPPARRGRPRVFVSHGSGDRVLPADATSRRIVPRLQAGGYEVSYREFDGGHAIPAVVQAEAARWLGWAGAAREGGAP